MKKLILAAAVAAGCFIVVRRASADNAGRLSTATSVDDEPTQLARAVGQ